MQAFELNSFHPAVTAVPPSDFASAAACPHPPAVNLPPLEYFSAGWHPHLGSRLAAFPRSIPADEWNPHGYWPDLATLVGDEGGSQLAYFPVGLSAFSVQVIYEEGCYRVLQYRDACLVARGEAESCEEALAISANLSR